MPTSSATTYMCRKRSITRAVSVAVNANTENARPRTYKFVVIDIIQVKNRFVVRHRFFWLSLLDMFLKEAYWINSVGFTAE